MSSLVSKYYRYRSAYWRWQRVLFPSPAEVRFIELMGGRVIRFEKLKHPETHFPFVLVLSLGKTLKREKFKREVRYGKCYVDFANDIHRIIEIDGAAYHADPVADMEREIYIHARNTETRFLRIQAHKIGLESMKTQQRVLDFIS